MLFEGSVENMTRAWAQAGPVGLTRAWSGRGPGNSQGCQTETSLTGLRLRNRCDPISSTWPEGGRGLSARGVWP